MEKISDIIYNLYDDLDNNIMKSLAIKIAKDVESFEKRKHLILSKNELEELVDSKRVKYEDYIGNILIDKFD